MTNFRIVSRGEPLSVQETLGYAVDSKSKFLIKIPHDERIYEPIYHFIDAELCNGQLIGHIEDLVGEPNLIVSRISSVDRIFTVFTAKVDIIKSIPILHKDDGRTLAELPCSEFVLAPDRIKCIFDPIH